MPNQNKATLTSFVSASLTKAAARRFKQSFTPSSSLATEDEMTALNRYWRAELYHLEADTIDARESLLDHCDPNEWKSLFKRHVLPLIEMHHLPR